MIRIISATVVLLTAGAVLFAADGNDKLPAPKYKALLVCFNFNAGSGSGCRSPMAKIEDGLRVVRATSRCGRKGKVSEITWTYRGQKDGKDVYHVVRKFPVDTDAAKTTETVVNFDGERHYLFVDKAQCIFIELQPAEE